MKKVKKSEEIDKFLNLGKRRLTFMFRIGGSEKKEREKKRRTGAHCKKEKNITAGKSVAAKKKSQTFAQKILSKLRKNRGEQHGEEKIKKFVELIKSRLFQRGKIDEPEDLRQWLEVAMEVGYIEMREYNIRLPNRPKLMRLFEGESCKNLFAFMEHNRLYGENEPILSTIEYYLGSDYASEGDIDFYNKATDIDYGEGYSIENIPKYAR